MHGNRASSTVGPEFAARRLAEKLFGDTVVSVEEDSQGCSWTRRFVAVGRRLAGERGR